jgi:peptidoglycan/LPS O-acetylase OafA/YrhL
MQKERYGEIDALRGIAALMVVVFHFSKAKTGSVFLRFGVTGVDLFFIISGFVILMTLEKTTHWKDFVISRLSRLYPTYCTCVSLTAIIVFTKFFMEVPSGKLAVVYAANLTMFQQYFHIADLDAPYWTMLVEMIFYGFMLLVFITKQLKNIVVVGGLLLLPIFIYSTEWFRNAHGNTYENIRFYMPLVNHFPLFFTGILFYKIKFTGGTLISYLLILISFVVQLFLFNDGGRSYVFISFLPYVVMLVIYYAVFALYVKGYLAFIKTRILLFLGSISFSLYLFHEVFGTEVVIPQLIKRFNLNYWVAASIAILVVIGTAYIISNVVEKPAMAYIRKKFIKPKQQAGGQFALKAI